MRLVYASEQLQAFKENKLLALQFNSFFLVYVLVVIRFSRLQIAQYK